MSDDKRPMPANYDSENLREANRETIEHFNQQAGDAIGGETVFDVVYLDQSAGGCYAKFEDAKASLPDGSMIHDGGDGDERSFWLPEARHRMMDVIASCEPGTPEAAAVLGKAEAETRSGYIRRRNRRGGLCDQSH